MNSVSNIIILVNQVILIIVLILFRFYSDEMSNPSHSLLFGSILPIAIVGIIFGFIEIKKNKRVAIVGLAGNSLIVFLFVIAILIVIQETS